MEVCLPRDSKSTVSADHSCSTLCWVLRALGTLNFTKVIWLETENARFAYNEEMVLWTTLFLH